MLHILLLILKIIGIILAVILGIIILLLGIVLFVPIRYEIAAKCDGTIDSLRAKVKVTWLLRILRAEIFLKGKILKWQIKAAWINKSNAVVFGGQKEEKQNEAEKSKEVKEEVFKNEVSQETSEIIEEKQEEDQEDLKEERLEENSQKSEEKCENVSETDETAFEEGIKKSISDKIKEKYEKIKSTIEDLIQKKNKIFDFLTDESHIHALKKLKKEVFILLRKLKPKKANIKLKFGFEDPSLTGKVLGGISILYPVLGDTIDIIPDFENQILQGNVHIKGRIRCCHFAALALKLLLCKDIRKSYVDIRNFKL